MDFSQTSDALVIPDWPAPAPVRAVVTTRSLPGNSQPPFDAFNLGLRSGESQAVVRSNRALLVRALGLPSAPRWLRQVHGNHAASFDETGAENDDEERQADAAITRIPGTVLAILTADCMPILLCAADGSEVAAVHAGWRGMAAGVIETCVGQLRAAPARLIAWLGPAIGQDSYEVGEEVRAAFLAPDPSANAAFRASRPGHWHCDLYTLARQRLHALGVTAVYGGGFDTFADERFYSYRRDGANSGRFASLIWSEPSR
ncbi:MAG TPA: peptidoglycan editing factor PgeF [Rudaea sp.]|nr:peptidoglycan editing factor PgeF [Rudaea sp.]